jgi:Flp pilus assembly protein TadB
MVLLVLPALLVIVLTVMAVIAPGLSETVATPFGRTTTRGLVVYASAAFVVVAGLGASVVVAGLRPPGQTVTYERPDGPLAVLASTLSNPESAAVALLAPATVVGAGLARAGLDPVTVALGTYTAYGVPVGLVAVRRARLDDAKDRELKDFVHAVSGHVNLGRPFPEAVELVARDVDLGALNEDVADLALNIGLATEPGGESTRAAALARFTERVGTPLAEQTVGLVAGALAAGSDAGTVFDTLQTEVGRLYHEKRKLRSAMLVYVAVGWTTALLVVGITVAVGLRVFDGFSQLAALSESTGYLLDSTAVDLPRARYRLYVVTQATMLGSGWFAGAASRGRFEALLHSGVLVAVCYAVFAATGLV